MSRRMKPRLNVVLTRFRWDWSLFFASTCSATRCVKATFTRFHWKFILLNDQKSLFSWLHFKSQLKVLNFSMNQELKWGWTKIFFRNLRALEIIAPTSQFTFSRFCARVPPRERGAALFLVELGKKRFYVWLLLKVFFLWYFRRSITVSAKRKICL